MAAKTIQLASPADTQWGYAFGVDGLMDAREVCEFLGNVSRTTIDRLVAARRIRKGNTGGKGNRGGRGVYCRRSVAEYARSLES